MLNQFFQLITNIIFSLLFITSVIFYYNFKINSQLTFFLPIFSNYSTYITSEHKQIFNQFKIIIINKKQKQKAKIIVHLYSMIVYRQCIKIPHFIRLLVFLSAIVIILLTLIINGFWMEPLYKEGVNMIHSAQSHLPFYILRIINNLFSMLCHPSSVGVLLIVQLCLVKHKFKALIHISFFLLCIYFIAFLKQAYQQSRPIWSSNQIHKWEWFCPKDFGNPSGHSFALFPLYQPIISKYIGFQNFRTAWIFLIIFGFLVPFSRTYLGVHSVNQVMFGLTIGVAATVLYRYGIRQFFYVILSKIFKLKKLKYLIAIIILHIFCFFLPFLFFQIYSENKPMQKSDVKNLNQFCLTDLSSLLIQQSMLVKCTLESFVFGIMYGLFFLKVTKQEILYFSGRWDYVSWKAALWHFLSITLLCGFIGTVFIIMLPRFLKITFLDYLSHTIGIVLIGFSIVYILPKIERTYQWISYHYQSLLIKTDQQLKEISQNEKNNVSQFFG